MTFEEFKWYANKFKKLTADLNIDTPFFDAVLKLLEEKRELRDGIKFYSNKEAWTEIIEAVQVNGFLTEISRWGPDNGTKARELLERIKE